jgi:hypothetical protein
MIATEAQEAKALWDWCKIEPIPRHYMLRITNDGTANIVRGVSSKKQGLRKGVSDYLLAYPVGKKHGLWIELKRQTGSRISPEQLIWLERMRDVGYEAGIAYGWEHAVRLIYEYLHGN